MITRPLVLIVEDSPTCSSHLAARLRAAPHHARVYTTDTLSKAREWLLATKHEGLLLAVLDVHLPDGSGLELLPLLEGVHTVVVTANPDAVRVHEGVTVIAKGSAWATRVELVLNRLRNQA